MSVSSELLSIMPHIGAVSLLGVSNGEPATSCRQSSTKFCVLVTSAWQVRVANNSLQSTNPVMVSAPDMHSSNHHQQNTAAQQQQQHKAANGTTKPAKLSIYSIDPRVIAAEYAVRGEIVRRAQLIAQDLEQGKGAYPFDKVVWCNIGNPQILGQKPITFFRQVLCLCEYPQVGDHQQHAY